MSYSIEIITKEEQGTSAWSGGTTTELAIYPKESKYSERNFDWRISSARVELEESTFSSLSGIWRYIMVLEGEMYLEHLGHHSIYLKTYEKDSFSGSWTTKSRGRVRDFNLMVANGYKGEIEALKVIDEINIKEEDLYDSYEDVTWAIFCTEGKVEIEADENSKVAVDEGDVVLIKSKGMNRKIKFRILNNQCNASRVIRTVIYK